MKIIWSILEIIAGLVILIHAIFHFHRGIIYTISCLLISFLFFYWAFKRNKNDKCRDDSIENKVISSTFIMNVIADVLIPTIIVSQKNGQLLELTIALIILFGLPYLIGKYFFTNRTNDKTKKIFFFITFPMILFFTAGLLVFPFEGNIGWMVVLFLPVNILFWFIQVQLIKDLYKKDKNFLWYWFYNILSPFWLIWMTITFKTNLGVFLYGIGALLLVLFVLKENPFKNTSLSSKDIELRKKDYDKLLANHLISTENYEKIIKQLNHLS